jgi:hypothetical protein
MARLERLIMVRAVAVVLEHRRLLALDKPGDFQLAAVVEAEPVEARRLVR